MVLFVGMGLGLFFRLFPGGVTFTADPTLQAMQAVGAHGVVRLVFRAGTRLGVIAGGEEGEGPYQADGYYGEGGSVWHV
jgi:hypothetical protein